MVAIEKVKAEVASLVHSRPLVAVFVGGTNGIGKNTVRQLAAVHGARGPGLRAYIIGRNQHAAEETIAVCRKACPSGQFSFIGCRDLSLIQDVDKTCNKIIARETEATREEGAKQARIDMLYISSGAIISKARVETEEGLGRIQSLVYYSRMRIIVNLMPLLKASNMPAHVVSVFGAGLESGGTFHSDDLAQREPGHGGMLDSKTHVVRMTTLLAEALVEEDPQAPSIVHVNPGLVMTTVFETSDFPSFLKVIFRLLTPLLRLFAYSDEENGLRMLYLSTNAFPARSEGQETATRTIGSNGQANSGVYAVGEKGEPIPAKHMTKFYATLRSQGMARKVYEHTMRAFQDISAGGRSTG